jgi:hypothetical protein
VERVSRPGEGDVTSREHQGVRGVLLNESKRRVVDIHPLAHETVPIVAVNSRHPFPANIDAALHTLGHDCFKFVRAVPGESVGGLAAAGTTPPEHGMAMVRTRRR